MYAYAANDPVNMADPSGLLVQSAKETVLGGYKVLTNNPHETLDVLGLTPVIGIAFDVTNAAAYAAQGDGFNAAISIGAAVPSVGMAVTGTRLGVKGASAFAKSGDNLTTVIGRVDDLKKLKGGEQSLMSRLPDQGNPKVNWKQNSGVLRQEMSKMKPILDASPRDRSGQFLNAERNLLISRGWKPDKGGNYWNPPKVP